jgi:hypothetical protein
LNAWVWCGRRATTEEQQAADDGDDRRVVSPPCFSHTRAHLADQRLGQRVRGQAPVRDVVEQRRAHERQEVRHGSRARARLSTLREPKWNSC